jgi:hypothetical protein
MNTPMIAIQDIQEPVRKARKGCQYTDEERAVLGKFKAAYKATTNHSQRDALMRGSIFPEMWNFWFQKEQVMPTEEQTLSRRKVRLTQFFGDTSQHSPESL